MDAELARNCECPAGSRSRKISDSIDTLNELASFIPTICVNTRLEDTIPKKDEYLHKTSTLAKPYLDDSTLKHSASLSVPSGHSYRRSLSLKSSLRNKKNSQKKMVRFADSLGLDLEQTNKVKTDDPGVSMQIFVPYGPAACASRPRFTPSFNLPSVMQIDKRLNTSQVCLESIAVGGYIIKGVIKVNNLSYHKTLTVRYTVDNWSSFTEVKAAYIKHASDGFTDKFSFTIDLTLIGESKDLSRLELAIRYQAENVGEFWDNNATKNYCFKYEDPNKALQAQPSWFDDTWLHFK